MIGAKNAQKLETHRWRCMSKFNVILTLKCVPYKISLKISRFILKITLCTYRYKGQIVAKNKNPSINNNKLSFKINFKIKITLNTYTRFKCVVNLYDRPTVECVWKNEYAAHLVHLSFIFKEKKCMTDMWVAIFFDTNITGKGHGMWLSMTNGLLMFYWLMYMNFFAKNVNRRREIHGKWWNLHWRIIFNGKFLRYEGKFVKNPQISCRGWHASDKTRSILKVAFQNMCEMYKEIS